MKPMILLFRKQRGVDEAFSAETGNAGMGSNARDHASLRRHDDEERHIVVFSGFPAKSRKKLLNDNVKLQLLMVERLAGQTDLLDLGDSLRPGHTQKRCDDSSSEQFKFLSAWKQADEAGLISKFGDDELVIRAKRDKPPAIRKGPRKTLAVIHSSQKPWTQ